MIEISTPEQLQDIATSEKYNEDITGDFILTNDIDLKSIANFEPIGNVINKFIGTFNGNGHTISNLNIYKPNAYNIGLFGYIENAHIKNVQLLDVHITGESHVGGLVGNMQSGIVAGHSNGYITGYVCTGGLVGYMRKGTVTGYNTGAVSGKYGYVGGLLGGIGNGIVTGYNTGHVRGIIVNKVNVTNTAGLVGLMTNGTVIGYNTGAISRGGIDVCAAGELVAKMNNGTLKGYANGDTSTHVGVKYTKNGTTPTINTETLPEVSSPKSSYPLFGLFGNDTGHWVDRSSEGKRPDLNI